jgi:NAD(P)-dependent dehydrogenase (short-subunit alcohol dehydrogenase family)
MDLQLKDKVIVITGGAKGIGEGIVKVLAAENALPVIVGRNQADNEMTLKAVGRGWQVTAELADPLQCKSAVEQIVSNFGKIDGLVNNAGVNDGINLEHGSYEGFISSLHKNVVHYYLMAHYALPELIRSKGSIVNIGSKVAKPVRVVLPLCCCQW